PVEKPPAPEPEKPASHPLVHDKNTAPLQTLAQQLEAKPPESELQEQKETAPPVAEPAVPTAGMMILLDPGTFTKLAAFNRAGKLWLVVDKNLPGFAPKFQGEGNEALAQSMQRMESSKATAFIFDTPPNGTVYSIRHQKSEWRIALNPGDKPYLPDNVPVNIADDAKSISIYAGENPTVLPFTDPVLGDKIWVVPMRTPEGRILARHETPGYNILPSLIGAALIIKDDALNLGILKDMVMLQAQGKKIPLSSEADRAKSLKQAEYNPVFRLDVPKLKAIEFNAQRQELEAALVEQKSDSKKAAILMDLARLNMQHGFGQEANGLLRIAKDLSPAIETSREYRALRGISAALTGDTATAEADLKSDELQSYPAAKLWLGSAQARNNNWPEARNSFAETGSAESAFPPMLQPRLILAKAEALTDAGDIAAVGNELKKISDEKMLSPSEKAELSYIRARMAGIAKDKETSAELLEALANGTDPLYRTKAVLALTAQQVADKQIKLPQAIETLEQLRFSWRGDRLEIDVLRALGQYYIDNGQYLEGLDIWRQAAGLSKNDGDTDAITQNMQNVFKQLFVDGKADKLPAIKSVSLFERFRELTPPGEQGDIAQSRLATRLASVDLLDQADVLMDKQLQQNKTGEQAAATGAKLASWRLLNNNPAGALKALDDSTQNDSLPEKLSGQRLLLRARALADKNQVDEALALLNTDQSAEALSLKADINWRQNRWSDAIDAMQNLTVKYRDDGKTDSKGPMPGLILKMAIALTLDGNTKGVELLAAQYGTFMATTDKAQAFNLITKPSRGSALADLATLKGQVGEVELFQKFLKDFSK
ncbi:MAG: hypothetical protein JWM96_448, partial [Alphaproteobacteria bacterium]|nr:hypothetical protein [Alphaproteobacteria bacterium]